MCRWLAYSGRPIFLEALVSKPCHSLIRQSHSANECLAATNGDGFGLGWYGAWDEPGLFRDAMPAWNDDNLRSLTHQISSSLFFAHVRASTGTPSNRVNCHPFVNGRWMFMHNGQIGEWERVRRKLEARLCDARYALRRGTTDSELMFLMLDEVTLALDPVRAMFDVLTETRKVMIEAGVREPLRLTAALTDGTNLYAFRYSSDATPPTLYWRAGDDGIIVVSEPIDANREMWSAVAPNTVLVVEPSGRCRQQPFDVEAALTDMVALA
ncbi:class II glutamine amidotransferase [Oryzibacter oryziterrae]|uniref:class II glutamine amidotransferase n=1 Tax=Oryzibacter oryziterrae TaxID=2766474 RepID=UPI001F47968B|nr:class II glutamine amidotransferase [Oryzibacter oryziterrae]